MLRPISARRNPSSLSPLRRKTLHNIPDLSNGSADLQPAFLFSTTQTAPSGHHSKNNVILSEAKDLRRTPHFNSTDDSKTFYAILKSSSRAPLERLSLHGLHLDSLALPVHEASREQRPPRLHLLRRRQSQGRSPNPRRLSRQKSFHHPQPLPLYLRPRHDRPLRSRRRPRQRRSRSSL